MLIVREADWLSLIVDSTSNEWKLGFFSSTVSLFHLMKIGGRGLLNGNVSLSWLSGKTNDPYQYNVV